LMPFVVEARRQLAEARPSKTRRLSTGSRPLERRQQAKRRWIQASFATVAALGGWMLFHMIPYWRAPQPRLLDEMVRIPGGSFIYQGGEMRELPTFWISKYEVSIAQYARFLEHLASSSGHRYDHPRQPATKSTHRPPAWDELLATARKGGVWRGQAVDVNCPVTDVDYWDAWAYAAWRGQRLPTEMEWEKAARSTDGRLYPWGSHPDAPSANTGADVDSGPDLGRKDGYASWAPVDAFTTTDISPYGVVGMAGNVSEWTDSTMLHPDILDQQVPVLRGGSYAARPADLQQRRPALNAGVGDPTVGFRTASDRAP
jgi:formylglycine-generating enzyme required for sulfatase activity